jgi:hypothetical protein
MATRRVPQLITLAVWLALGVGRAQADPGACSAYEASRLRLVQTKAAPVNTNPIGRLMTGEGAANQATADRLNKQTQIDKVAQLAHLCVGDLVAEGRFDDASRIAARAGFLDDALKLEEFAQRQRSK